MMIWPAIPIGKMKGCATQFKETLVLKSSRSRAILGALDILVDIGVPAEKEVIL